MRDLIGDFIGMACLVAILIILLIAGPLLVAPI